MKYPEAWQALAETNVRLARLAKPRSKLRSKHIAAAEAALQRTFSMNPFLAAAKVTQGALLVLRAKETRDPQTQQNLASEARLALQAAGQHDPLLRSEMTTLTRAIESLHPPE